MNQNSDATPGVTTLTNVLTVEPNRQEELLRLLRENVDTCVSKLDGWISTTLVAASDGRRVVINSQWRDAAAVDAMRANLGMQKYFPRIAALASLDSVTGEQVFSRHA